MKKTHGILCIIVIVALVIATAIIYQTEFQVPLIETIYEKNSGELSHIGLIYNGQTYYGIDDFTYFIKDIEEMRFEKDRENLFNNYCIPQARNEADKNYFSVLHELIDTDDFPALPKYKSYSKISDDYMILKADSYLNPIFIFKRYEEIGGHVNWIYYLREDFDLSQLPTVENSAVKEIRIVYGDDDIYILGDQEKQAMLNGIKNHSSGEIEVLFSTMLLNETEETIINLEIVYENSPLVQYVGYYNTNSNQFFFSNTEDDTV